MLGEIDLGGVAGDDRPRIHAQPSEKHEHLFGRRVLGFVQNDEGVIECPSTHVSQWSNFNDTPIAIFFDFFRW